MGTQLRIPILDLAIIVVYVIGILAIGIRSTRNSAITGNIYFLAGRSLPWGVVDAIHQRRVGMVRSVFMPVETWMPAPVTASARTSASRSGFP